MLSFEQDFSRDFMNRFISRSKCRCKLILLGALIIPIMTTWKGKGDTSNDREREQRFFSACPGRMCLAELAKDFTSSSS